jgi:hypothetical protein
VTHQQMSSARNDGLKVRRSAVAMPALFFGETDGARKATVLTLRPTPDLCEGQLTGAQIVQR